MNIRFKRLLAKIWHLFFQTSPEVYLGRLLFHVLPESYLDQIRKNYFRYSFRDGYVNKLVRDEMMRQYYCATGEEFIRLRKLYWATETGKSYHDKKIEMYSTPEGYRENFLKQRAPLVKFIRNFLKKRPNFQTICEIGTSNGTFLEFLSKELDHTNIRQFVGLEINRQQIKENQAKFRSNKHLQFQFSEVSDWINIHRKRGVIFVGCAVFQCFTQDELESLFGLMKKYGPVAVGISESVNMDLEKDFQSSPRGNTYFSHNYPFLLKAAGYKILDQTIQYHSEDKNHSTVILLGVSED